MCAFVRMICYRCDPHRHDGSNAGRVEMRRPEVVVKNRSKSCPQDSNHAWAEEEEAQWVVVPKGEESW